MQEIPPPTQQGEAEGCRGIETDQIRLGLLDSLIGKAAMLSRSVALSDSLALKASLPQVWQYNEVWPTVSRHDIAGIWLAFFSRCQRYRCEQGGWGSIEYGFPSRGQVIGGRWKPLHHWYKQSLYADVMATCGQGGICYVKNDGCREFTGYPNAT